MWRRLEAHRCVERRGTGRGVGDKIRLVRGLGMWMMLAFGFACAFWIPCSIDYVARQVTQLWISIIA